MSRGESWTTVVVGSKPQNESDYYAFIEEVLGEKACAVIRRNLEPVSDEEMSRALYEDSLVELLAETVDSRIEEFLPTAHSWDSPEEKRSATVFGIAISSGSTMKEVSEAARVVEETFKREPQLHILYFWEA